MNVCNEAKQSYLSRIKNINQEPANEPAIFIFRIKLKAANMNKKPPFRSKFTIVCWTGPSEISPAMKHEVEFGSHSSLNLLSLYNLSFHLASGKPGIRKLTNHSTSNLTKLLYDEIGGNCYTRIILCLSSNPDPEIYSFLLRLTSQLTNITNSPVMNDECALLLAARERETQYLLEEMIKEYKTGINLTNSSANLPNTESSMLKLKEHVQELSVSLGKTQEELAHATDERVKLSKAWLISEEDRIDANEKLAKTELELQEVTLKNKQLQLICEKATDAAKHAVELQKSNDMLNNYCTDLKRKLDDLHDELERMSIRNEELSRELLHQTIQQKSILTFLTNKSANEKLPKFEKELNRLHVMLDKTAFLKKNSKISSHPETHERKTNMVNRNSEPEIQRSSQSKSRYLNDKSILQNAENQVKLDLIMKERDQLQTELTNTNRKLTRFLNYFKARLIYHINGITRLVDATKSNDTLIANAALHGLEKYVKHLIADINATHKIRENRLVNIIRSLNTQFHGTREALHKVMICY
ncbi:coiled-coil domain-containing 78-like isoform X1, partial [Schistosoma japonicum]